jgi:hypothetical protein
MMKKYIINLIFLILPLYGFTQTVQEQFAGFGNISSVTSLGSSNYTIVLTGFTGSPRFEVNGTWVGSDVLVGDVLFRDGARYVVTLINSSNAGGFNVRVNSPDEGLGVSALNNGDIVAVGREYKGLFPLPRQGDNAGTGVPPSLASSIEIHNMKVMGNLGVDYITTDSFSTFTNGATFASIPIGKTIWRTTTGSKFEKTGTNTVTKRSTDNGESARLGLQGSGAVMTFNANLYNKVKVNTGDISATNIQNPSNFIIQEVGEVFLVGVTAGSSDVAVTWGDVYGTFNGSTFGGMPAISIPSQMTVYFKFRVITPTVESVKFQYVDGGGAGFSLATNGLQNISGSVGLGGTLTQNTVVTGGGFDINFNGLDSFRLDVDGLRVDLDGIKFLHTTGGTGSGDINENLFLGYKAGEDFPSSSVRYANTGIGYGALRNLDGTISGAATSTSNTAVGYEAGAGITNGTYNSFFGTASGATAGPSTLYNTGVGWHALIFPTGSENTATGASALGGASANASIGCVANGAFALSNSLSGSDNVAIGRQSMQTPTAPGNYNVGVGWVTLRANQASNLTAIGTQALQSNTTGTKNVAVGSMALNANLTGANNVAIGNDVLDVNTGSNNTAIGTSSMGANVGGANNTAIGFETLLTNISGVGNVAIGLRALKLNTNSDCTSVGAFSLENSTGANQTALGSNALNANTTGSENTAVGYNTLSANLSGASNTAIGSRALQNQRGSFNVGIGRDAGNGYTTKTITGAISIGYQANTVVSKDYNIAIGYQANSNVLDTTFSNVIAIGRGTRPTASNQITIGDSNGSYTQLKSRNYNFNIDQTVGAGQDNYVMTYDNGTGEIGLEAAPAADNLGNHTATTNINMATFAINNASRVITDSVNVLNPEFLNAPTFNYQDYTATGTLNRELAHYWDGTTDDTLTVNTALPDETVFFVKNKDAILLLTVLPGSGFTMSGDGRIYPGEGVWFQKHGTVIERITPFRKDFYQNSSPTTNGSGEFTVTHNLGTTSVITTAQAVCDACNYVIRRKSTSGITSTTATFVVRDSVTGLTVNSTSMTVDVSVIRTN